MNPPEPLGEGAIKTEYTADVVVLGAGHSGTAAAKAAIEAGASVILVEQQKGPKIHILGNQFGSFNSKFAHSRGVPEYDPVELMLDWQHRTLNRANPELIRQYAFTSGETFDWFIEPLPQEFKDEIHLFQFPTPSRFTGEVNGFHNYVGTSVFNDRKGLSLGDAVRFTHELMKEQGVQFFYNVAGDRLEKEAGRVTALIGRDRDTNDYIRFRANKGVILAAGDFSNNREMVLDLLDEFAELTDGGNKHPIRGGGWHGTGIKMGIWAGGHMEPGPRGGMWCSVAGSGGPMDGASCLRLNARGKRYTNEGIMGYWGAGLQGARQGKGAIRTVWDSDWLEELQCQTLDHTAVDMGDENMLTAMTMDMAALQPGPEGGMVRVNLPPEGVKVDPRHVRSFHCYKANTIEELADYLGYVGEYKENFLKSISRYNELCAKGRDEDFAKDARQLHAIAKAPFFGFVEENQNVGFLMVSVAGLMIDGDQAVLDDDNEPIPGLYATGNCSGCRFPIGYTTPIAGVSIGIAYALGRIVGRHVAEQ